MMKLTTTHSKIFLFLVWMVDRSSSFPLRAKNPQPAEDQDTKATTKTTTDNDGIPVGGWGDWKYVYEPSFLQLPPEAAMEHAHGIVIQDDGTITITYVDKDPSRCLVRWKPDEYDQIPEYLGPGTSLCKGVPHGLRADFEDNDDDDDDEKQPPKMVLYHANNGQHLHKTTPDGEILWSFQGKPEPNDKGPYIPTWMAAHPKSPYVHLADGYGSSKIYVLEKKSGNYTGHVFGGKGHDHGHFETTHAIAWDWRTNQMIVIDRENHRLEYYTIDPTDPSIFIYTHTVSFAPLLMRPCNIRMRKPDGIAIIPFLEGPVGILDELNGLLSVVNITDVLGSKGFLHPHDAHFMPDGSGDFVLATWNPGRIGYFRRVNQDDEEYDEKIVSAKQ